MMMLSLRVTLILLLLTGHSFALEFNGPSNGQSATAALDAAAQLVCQSKDDRTLKIPAGDYWFDAAPEPFPCALNIIGDGIGGTRLIRNFSGAPYYFLSWVRGTDHSGGSLRKVSIDAADGTFGGIAVWVKATADTDSSVNSFNRHSWIMEDVVIGRLTTNAGWNFGVYLDGYRNPDGNPNSVPGIRGIWISRSSAGGATIASFYLYKARGVDIHAECYTPLSPGAAAVKLDGATDSVLVTSRNCDAVYVDSLSMNLFLNRGVPVGR
jgi:hypothetical protein